MPTVVNVDKFEPSLGASKTAGRKEDVRHQKSLFLKLSINGSFPCISQNPTKRKGKKKKSM
jgi:hypothetical protein